MDKLPEVTWSLMHPTPLNVDYMKRVIAEAANYKVDSFEICAACHTLLGGLDGLVLYEDYPAVAASLDREGIIANRRRLNEILELAHASGRPVYYWHREVTVWPEFLKAVPGNSTFSETPLRRFCAISWRKRLTPSPRWTALS